MSKAVRTTIVNVGYRSTNYWVVSAGTSRLLVDLGWPGTMGKMRANLRRMDVPLHEIRYGLATHYHIDHAGLAQELKLAGVPLLVLEAQVNAIPIMKRWTKPRDNYVEITTHGNVTISFAESRAVLERIGIPGEILPTPGHSGDSVSLLLDDGSAFTGDLTHPAFVGERDEAIVSASWRLLRERGATRVYPAHGPVQPMHADWWRASLLRKTRRRIEALRLAADPWLGDRKGAHKLGPGAPRLTRQSQWQGGGPRPGRAACRSPARLRGPVAGGGRGRMAAAARLF